MILVKLDITSLSIHSRNDSAQYEGCPENVKAWPQDSTDSPRIKRLHLKFPDLEGVVVVAVGTSDSVSEALQ